MIGDGGHASVIKAFRDDDPKIIAVGDNATRKRLVDPDAEYEVVMHPTAIIHKSVEIGWGTVIMAGVIIQPQVKIGKHCIVNTGATVDHDCVVEDYAHIAPGAHLCGGVHVGEGALVGVGVGIEPGAVIPAWHIVKRGEYSVCPMK